MAMSVCPSPVICLPKPGYPKPGILVFASQTFAAIQRRCNTYYRFVSESQRATRPWLHSTHRPFDPVKGWSAGFKKWRIMRRAHALVMLRSVAEYKVSNNKVSAAGPAAAAGGGRSPRRRTRAGCCCGRGAGPCRVCGGAGALREWTSAASFCMLLLGVNDKLIGPLFCEFGCVSLAVKW